MLTVAALMMMAAASARPPSEMDGAMACRSWTERGSGSAAGTHSPLPGVLCFNGVIDDQSSAAFVAAARGLQGPKPPTIVVRSPGGEVGAALDMAAEIVRIGATVIAADLCISSCANYILAAGKRRMVLSGTILGFHGGARPITLEEFEGILRAGGVADARAQAAIAHPNILRTVQRQRAFLMAKKINPEFFEWMHRINEVPTARARGNCPSPGAAFYVFDPDILEGHGYRIHSYAGPRSQEGVAAALAALRLPSGAGCFLGKAEAGS